ncbi:MAG: Cytochrome c5530 family protein, partial [Parcubacteria group bacterium GW2011_GWA2_37_10]
SNYHFTTWSDGSTANPRTDTNIVSDISAAANFEINNTGGGGGGGSSCCGGRVDTTPTPVVVHPPPIVQPEIQPILEPEPKLQIGPELALIVSPVIAYPVTISPNIVKNTAPAKIIPEIPEVLSVEQNQNSEPEQITAAEPTVPLETSQPSALSLGSRINAIFTAAISNIVIQSVSAVISFFKNLKWW